MVLGNNMALLSKGKKILGTNMVLRMVLGTNVC